VATAGHNRVWLVETAGQRLCLLTVREQYGSAGTSCAPRSALLTTGVTLAVKGVADADPRVVIVAVPDGYTQATALGTTASVAHNVAVMTFDRLPPGDLRIAGPGLPTVTLPLVGLDVPAVVG
jgi:hypothetical protein